MDFLNVLRSISDSSYIDKFSLINFRADTYSALFFSYLISYLKKNKKLNIAIPNFETTSLKDLKAALQMSFLGLKQYYWIKDLSSFDSASKAQWINFLNSYDGPHCIIFSCSKDITIVNKNNNLFIDLPESINHEVYSEIYNLFFEKLVDLSFIKKLFQLSETIPLDTACMLMVYQFCLGRKSEAFFNEWIDKLLIMPKSLFNLSQCLFAGQNKEFFAYWQNCKDNYPQEFWIVFWCEQLWQASLYVEKAEQKNMLEARKVVNRLPFSFMNKDWRNYSRDFLSKAHNFLYSVDFALKNSSGTFGIELFYYKFLLKNF